MSIETPVKPAAGTASWRRWSAGLADDYAAQGRSRALRRDGLTVGAWTLAASSVALFLADQGANYFTTLGGAVTGLGIIAGLLATVAMMLMLALASRVPAIDRTLGQDRALAAHSWLGKGMVYGLFAHGLLLVTGYAITARINLVAQFADLWGTFDFVLACLSFVGFAVVGITSVMALRKHAYEAWYAIHLLSYAAIAASLPHQFSMSGMLAPGTLGRPFWAILWLATAFVMLTWRFFKPLFSTLEHGLRVSRITPVGTDAVSIEMTGRNLDALGARGGHWLNWRFLTGGLTAQPHPFSLSADPTNTTMRITVRNLGAGTDRLIRSLRPGTRVAVEGPYGMFTDEARTRGRVVLVGSGIGIAPIRALLESTSFTPGQAVVILRSSTPEDLYLADEIRALAAAKGATLYHLIGRRAPGQWVDEASAGLRLSDFAPWVRDADVYFCGPDAWMDAVEADARALGVPASQLHDERFAW